MAPGRGITISPGANVDFSALAGASHSRPLLARATNGRTNAGGIVFIVILVLIVVSLIFCAVVVLIILKNKRQKRKRQQQLREAVPTTKHEYRTIEDLEPGHGTGGAYELSPETQAVGPTSDASQAHAVHQLDGFVAAPQPSAQPAELPTC